MASFYTLACTLGALSTVFSLAFSGELISKHIALKNGALSIRVLLMVPVFAVVSFVGLLEIDGSETLATVLEGIKEVYEAYVIHCFLLLMFELVGIKFSREKHEFILPNDIKGRHVHHSFPFHFFMKDMIMEVNLLSTLTSWTVQFVYVRPVLAIVEVALELFDAYSSPAHVLLTIILNISISVAMYALISFFHAFYKELEPHRPLAKFLVIKGVVFFAFWQEVLLQFLIYLGIIHQDHWYTVQELSTAIQNLLVCFEMGFIFAPALRYAFPIFKASSRAVKKTETHEHDK